MVPLILAVFALHGSTATFVGRVHTVTRAELGASWHPGCPVATSALRTVEVSYWGFDGRSHVGTLVVNKRVTNDMLAVFGFLWRQHFPIRRMRAIAAYDGDDNASMAADNTSAFNCRYAVAPGAKHWSVHAYGEAVDVNPVENPYREAGKVLPPAGKAYLDRTHVRPGMAVVGGRLVNGFAGAGWHWGGTWTSPDYQHFSLTGG